MSSKSLLGFAFRSEVVAWLGLLPITAFGMSPWWFGDEPPAARPSGVVLDVSVHVEAMPTCRANEESLVVPDDVWRRWTSDLACESDHERVAVWVFEGTGVPMTTPQDACVAHGFSDRRDQIGADLALLGFDPAARWSCTFPAYLGGL